MIEGAIKYVRQAVMEEYLVEFLAELVKSLFFVIFCFTTLPQSPMMQL